MYNSAIAAGYSKYSAIKANRIEKKLDDLKDYLERAGITNIKLAELLNKALYATKVIGYLHNYKKGAKGLEKISPNEIISNEFIETEDWPTRLKAMELVTKITGQLKDSLFIDQSKHSHLTKIENKPTIIFEGIKEENANRNLSENRISSEAL